MSSDVSAKPECIALLSAAFLPSAGQANSEIGALHHIAGSSLISWQVAMLRDCGVATFLIEVDSVSGELLNVADSLRHDGVRVEFVRSAQELQRFLMPNARLIVQAEAHYFSAPIVADLTQRTTPFIATIDGRDENDRFERIDLNTRWVGFAVLDAGTARSLMELPEGWSITSSLLRHAVQRGTAFLPIAQGKLQDGDIARISTQADADALAEHMLFARTSGAPGFIERHVFGGIAKWLAPYIWSSRPGTKAVEISKFPVALASLGCSAAGWIVAAAFTALFATFLHMLAGVTGSFGDSVRHRSQQLLFWSILAASALTAALAIADFGQDTMPFVGVSIGLILAAQEIGLPRWCAALLRSPALIAVAMFVAAGFAVFAIGAKMIALAQVGLLVAGLYLPKIGIKNRNQA